MVHPATRMAPLYQVAIALLLSGCHAFQVSAPTILRTPLFSHRTSTSLLSSATSSPPTLPSQTQHSDDARGAALWLDDVSVYRGPNPVLRGVDWRIEPGQKWAIVGANGAGKSTLLQAIVGQIGVAQGRVFMSPQFQKGIGYLQQTAVAGSNRTVYEEAASGMHALAQAKQDMETALLQANMEAYDTALTKFEALDGYQQDKKIANILSGLGFADPFDIRCDELSGGWQMRVALAKLLLSEPTLCILDEPSNHLDESAKRFLAKYLRDYTGQGSMILVTHDVQLLQTMSNIAELIPGAPTKSLQIYKSCNYDQYLNLKEQRAAAAISEYERNLEIAAKLQAFVDKWGASATKATAAQSRQKQLDKMRKDGLLDDPAMAIVAKRFKPTVVLPKPPKAMGNVLLSLEKALVGHDASKPLVSNVNLKLTQGMKLLIRGPNGSGKSTTLHSLRGSIPLLEGERKENPNLYLGMFTQDLPQELDVNARAVDLVTAHARTGLGGDITISDEKARSAMGRLGLTGEKPLRRIKDLSGGEKARVALAMFTLKPCNLYLFDEVSNHLDHECVEALGDALRHWGDDFGAIVVVSHDEAFCSQLEFTHVATVADGKLVLEQRDACASDWLVGGMAAPKHAADALMSSEPANGQPVATPSAPAPKVVTDPDIRKKLFNAPKRIKKIEQQVAKLEQEVNTADESMLSHGNDLVELNALQKQKDVTSRKIDALMQEWDELESLLAEYS
ncbi:hypothetical protein MPSEU_000748300 [Mayamaea pseudoterrestris]|nr:hypothetical protein MPSEU_000748300 [Mayamaea pseudoterrestris]